MRMIFSIYRSEVIATPVNSWRSYFEIDFGVVCYAWTAPPEV